MNPQNNKNLDEISDLFSQYLSGVFEMENETAEMLNEELILLLLENENNKKELINSMLVYPEKLTNKEFILDGKLASPTTANWINDFIKKNGTEMFNGLTLSQYIINSENAKKLDNNERKLITKIFDLYRNLKFFPTSMPNDTGDGWEIVPVKTETLINKARTVSGSPKTVEEKQIDQLVKIKIDEKTSPLVKLALDEEIECKKKIEDLKIMASKYREGSLEWRAIKEEIRKIEK